MQELLLGFAAITGISAAGFVVVAVMWLGKLRETVSAALTESANQQIRTTHHLSEAIAEVQKHQRTYEQQLSHLSQVNAQLRQNLVTAVAQLQHGQVDAQRIEPTIH